MNLSKADQMKLQAELDLLEEREVRVNLSRGIYNKDKTPYVHEWLRSKEELRQKELEAQRDKRELEAMEIARNSNAIALDSNSIASEANSIARSASRSASRANFIAIIAAISAIMAAVTAVMTYVNIDKPHNNKTEVTQPRH